MRKDPVASGGDGVLPCPAGYYRGVRASTALRARQTAGSLLALLIVAACQPSASVSPTSSEAATVGAPTTAPTNAGRSPAPSLAGQTDTAWGRIWDALPPSFPAMTGTKIATDTGEGASSAQLTVPAARDQVVLFYRQAFRDAGYSIGTDGPLEDGSVTVTATDGDQCRMQLSVRGTGAQASLVTVLYGAGCPFD
jgi:hypothetical protein